ncbi:uncharacterized mitochondrial protein-like protein [Tanacetum coccineum]
MDVKSAFLYGKIEEEVDVITLVPTKKELCIAFEKLMHEKFQMSSMGELTFFLGLQVKQKKDGIFISQDKYVEEILKKFGFTEDMTWRSNANGKKLKSPLLRMMMCVPVQDTKSNPKVSPPACSRQKRYIGLEQVIERLETCNEKQIDSMDQNSILTRMFVDYGYLTNAIVSSCIEDAEGIDCLPNSTIFEQLALMSAKNTAWNEFSSTMTSAIICEGSAIPTDPHHTPTIIQSSTQPQKTQKPRKPKRKDTYVPQPSGPTDIVADEAVHKELGDSLATPNEAGSQGTTSGGGPMCQETIGDTIAQTRFENVSKQSNDPLLARVLDLEKTQTTQQIKIDSLKRGVKKLEKKRSSRTHKLKRLYIVGLSVRVESSRDEESLDNDNEMFDAGTLTGDEVSTEQEVVAKDVNLTVGEVTLAQTLAALKSVKPKVKGDVIEEPSVPVSAASASTKANAATTTTATIATPRKGIVITELEPEKPMKKKDQISFDEETAKKLQAKFDEEARLAREKAEKEQEANVVLTEEWDDIQAKIEKRRKHFAAKRAEEQRNKPPTQAQQRKIICSYLENMEGKKLKDLKNKSFDSIQKMFDRAFKRVNTFVDFRTELVEGKENRAEEELIQESSKKQNVEDDKETT